ncbi:MAG: hypothetical protein WCV56_08600 [Candidatus Omnitrophota bacterium]
MDSVSITIIFIVLSAFAGVFLAGRLRDGCLLDWSGDIVHVVFNDGKVVWGVLSLEATGFELVYEKDHFDEKDAHIERSFIVYKGEYSGIRHIVRYAGDLNGKKSKERHKFLNKGKHRKRISRLKRNIRNFFATVRDSLMEVINLFMGKAKAQSPAKNVLAAQDRYISRIKDTAFSALPNSFEPLLERHLGKYVILEFLEESKVVECRGMLKDYTRDFIEILDMDYPIGQSEKSKKADIIFPRSASVIRHLGK